MQNTPAIWDSPIEETETQRRIQNEIDALEAAAAQQRAEIEARLKAENAKLAAWRGVLARGQAAYGAVVNAKSQLGILERRKAAAEAAFDALAGKWEFTEDWHAVTKSDPMEDGVSSHGERPGFPFVRHAEKIGALTLAIDRLSSIITTLEQAEMAAREDARRHAEENGLEFCGPEGDTESASPFVEIEPEPKGRRKAK